MTRAIDNYLDRERPVATTENDVSNDYAEYAALPGINWSRLKLARKSLLHYRDTPPRKDTATLGMLRAVHCLVLEPENFDRDFYVSKAPPATVESVRKKLGTNDNLARAVQHVMRGEFVPVVACDARKGSKAYNQAVQENPDCLIVKSKDCDALIASAHAIAHDIAAQNAKKTRLTQAQFDEATAIAGAVTAAHPLDDDTHTEVDLQWTDEATGLQCKGRADIVVKRGHRETREAWVIDLKTVQSVDPRQMARDVARYGYHGQLAHYAAGVEATTGRPVTRIGLLCVEGAAPHDVALFWLDDEAVEAGKALRDDLLLRVEEAQDTNHYPGQVPEPTELKLPQWAIDEAHGFDDELFTSSNTGEYNDA